MSFNDFKYGFNYESYATYEMVSDATSGKVEAGMDTIKAILEAQNRAWELYKRIGNCDASDELRHQMFDVWFELNDCLWNARAALKKEAEL